MTSSDLGLQNKFVLTHILFKSYQNMMCWVVCSAFLYSILVSLGLCNMHMI